MGPMNRKVLLVDDARKTVDLVRLYLEKDGYQVLPAYDGQQALELARHKAPSAGRWFFWNRQRDPSLGCPKSAARPFAGF